MNHKLINYLLSKNNINILSISLSITSLFTIITILLFPLFSDEIQIRMWLSRMPYEFPMRVTGVARCFSSFWQIIPTTFYPAATVNWLMHGLIESPTFLRFIGVLILVSWISILSIYACHRINCNNQSNKISFLLIASIICSLLFIGINPIFIGINRSEQLFYPSLLLLLIINFNNIERKYYKFIILLLNYFLISIIYYGHPKGLFFLPFFLYLIWITSINFKFPKLIFIIFSLPLLYLSFESFFSWSDAFKCSEIPEYEKFLKSFSFDPLSIFYDPYDFFRKSFSSLTRFNEYINHFEFKKQYIWNFLPGIKDFKTHHLLINFILKLFLIALFIFVFFITLLKIFKSNNNKKINIALFLLILLTSVWAIFNLTKNIYDASFFYTIICIVLIFFTIENNLFSLESKFFKVILSLIFIISLLSQAVFISNNLKPFINGFTGPGIRIGTYEFFQTHYSIKEASDNCGLNPESGSYIVIDDLTYGYFRKSHGPISFTYNRVGITKTPLQDLFRTVDSDGMILDCNNMPEQYRKISTRSNNICCISKITIKDLFIDHDNSELN